MIGVVCGQKTNSIAHGGDRGASYLELVNGHPYAIPSLNMPFKHVKPYSIIILYVHKWCSPFIMNLWIRGVIKLYFCTSQSRTV